VDDWLARDNVTLTDFAVPTVADEADAAAIEPLTFLIPETGTVTECVTATCPVLVLEPDARAKDVVDTTIVPETDLNPVAEVLDVMVADMVD
jgi:hypothetical protein